MAQGNFEQIASLYELQHQTVSFGDTDHDSRNEAVFYWKDTNFDLHYVILEEQGNDIYTEEFIGAPLLPYATGDLDQDGLEEIIGQYGAFVQVYESPNTFSHPSQLVWTSPAMSNFVGHTAIGDTDQDGKQEIIHSSNVGSSLHIFECSGDNDYIEVFTTTTGSQSHGDKVIADLDGDGLLEIAFSGTYGILHIFESPSDNVWVETFTDSTGLVNAYGAAGGLDTDSNGAPELFIAGDGADDFQKQTVVYESVGNDTYVQVTTFPTGEFSAGGAHNAVGTLDGTQTVSYLFEATDGLYVYQAIGIGQWETTLFVPDTSGHFNGIQLFDVNKNGRSELFWDSRWQLSMVLELPPKTSATGPSETNRFSRMSIQPNPCRVRSTIRFPPSLTRASRLSAYDVAGRLVYQNSSLSVLDGTALWEPNHLADGVYLLRLEDGAGKALAQGRAILLR